MRCLIVTFFLSFLSLLISDISVGLRDVRVVIPAAVKRGDNALLICNYDMEGDSLYSVKWYKGKREFYRYTPKEPQFMKTFIQSGINVEVKCNQVLWKSHNANLFSILQTTQSNASQVVISQVDTNTSGKFSCEGKSKWLKHFACH